MKTRIANRYVRLARPLAASAVVGLATLAATPAAATVITLENFNAVAQFATESGDAPADKGLFSWQVDGVDHMNQQWFWYRVGTTGAERSIDTLAQVQAVALDLDGTAGNDALLLRYRNAEETFELSVRYTLTGGATNSGNSSLEEVIRVVNLTGQSIDFHFFQYVDFDLGDTADDDAVVLSGTPVNTALQTDSHSEISETVVTPPPARFEVNEYHAVGGLEEKLGDDQPTTLDNSFGPLTNLDATWAFQWDFHVAPHGSYLISKNKSLRAIAVVPEPGSFALCSIAGVALLVRRHRRVARRAV
ncbi:MAG: PEP-CTERM sorting domain-containing protein [Pirellulales bacterium]